MIGRFLAVLAAALAFPAAAGADPVVFDAGMDAYVAPESTLDRVAALGADTARIRIDFGRDDWTLEEIDAQVAAARARGMSVLLTPTNYPAAATVGPLADRYPGVDWAVWNEPDLFGFQRNPYGYRRVLRATLRVLGRHGVPRSRVLIGETSPGVRPKWLRELGRLPTGVRGWAHHPYELPGAIRLARLHRLVDMPIFVTEAGAFTAPSFLGVAQTGAPLVRLSCKVDRTPWLRTFAQYLLNDDGFGTGLYARDGATPTPALTAYQNRCET